MDFRNYYWLESYLFDTVRLRFAQQHYLDAFDFFCIVIWKANRAKSKIARKLLTPEVKSLDEAVRKVTRDLAQQSNAKDRLRCLWNRDFSLPMASAVLTVLYPDEFTVYDERVCNMLGGFQNLKNITNFEALWDGYQDFKRKVAQTAPAELSLRDKDRYLWGKSFAQQLRSDIAGAFSKALGGGSFSNPPLATPQAMKDN